MSKVVCKFLPDIIYWNKMQLLLSYYVHIVSNILARNFYILLSIDNFIENISTAVVYAWSRPDKNFGGYLTLEYTF